MYKIIRFQKIDTGIETNSVRTPDRVWMCNSIFKLMGISCIPPEGVYLNFIISDTPLPGLDAIVIEVYRDDDAKVLAVTKYAGEYVESRSGSIILGNNTVIPVYPDKLRLYTKLVRS